MGLLGAPKADITELVDAGLSDAQIDNLKYAIQASIDRSIAVSLSGSFAVKQETTRVFEYEFELDRLGVSLLPRSLGEALDAFEVDPLGRRVMGDIMANAWLDYKREECHAYSVHVTEWEKERYLKFF